MVSATLCSSIIQLTCVYISVYLIVVVEVGNYWFINASVALTAKTTGEGVYIHACTSNNCDLRA